MKKRTGRPKEKPRKHLHLMVLPSTDKLIRSKVDRNDSGLNTHGKVVDKLVGGGE